MRLVNHAKNQGYGAACWTGMNAARKEYVFLMDSDGQFDPNQLEPFLPHCKAVDPRGADFVIGFRDQRADPPHRVLYARLWGIGATLLFGYVAKDIDCAFKLFPREVVVKVHPISRGATFTLEFLVLARKAGCSFKELLVNHFPRVAGVQTGGNYRVILRAIKELIRLRIALWCGSKKRVEMCDQRPRES